MESYLNGECAWARDTQRGAKGWICFYHEKQEGYSIKCTTVALKLC